MNVQQTKIFRLAHLIEELAQTPEHEFAFIASRLKISIDDLLERAVFSKEKYTRVCLVRNERYELLLLGWEPNQSTPIHGHDQQECWVHFVKGTFLESVYSVDETTKRLTRLRAIEAHEGSTSFMEDKMGYHKLENVSDDRALSLHLYVKPIDECLVYDEDKNAFSVLQLSYDKKVLVSS